jgi:hypothetical protein
MNLYTANVQVIKRKEQKLLVQNNSSIPLMSVTNACGDINYSARNGYKIE